MATAEDVKALYELYPYPSPIIGSKLIYDMANNLGFIFMNSDLAGKRILDAGCGTGHRLLGAARRFPRAEFWGLDMTSAPLDVAKRLAKKHNITNVHFQQADVLALDTTERFDIVVSTGVLHHLADPRRGLRNLASVLLDDGVMILWLYHALGEHQRLLDREILSTLLGDDRTDLNVGLSLLRDLDYQLEAMRYGSTAAPKRGEIDQDCIDVDAYLHPIVRAYRFADAIELFAGSSLDWTAINGINILETSKLIDLSGAAAESLRFLCVRPDDLFTKEALKDRYRQLDRRARLTIVELSLKPNGFTIIAGRGTSYAQMDRRVEGNSLPA